MALIASVLAGCVPEFTDDQSLIEGPRVLATRAEPAEAAPGSSVILRALVAAPEGQALNEDSLRWYLCEARKPLTELGPIAPSCVASPKAPTEALVELGAGLEVTAPLMSDVCRRFGPLAPPPEPGSDISGRPVDPDSSGGFYQPLVLGFDQPTLASVRIACGAVTLPNAETIAFNRGYRPNENPEIESVQARIGGRMLELDGTALATVPPGARVEFSVRWPSCPEVSECGDGLCTASENETDCAEDCGTEPRGCAGAETYLLADLETRTVITQREELRVAWYASAGSFLAAQTGEDDSDQAATNTWTAPEQRTNATVWVVLRDDRGGVHWATVRLRVARTDD